MQCSNLTLAHKSYNSNILPKFREFNDISVLFPSFSNVNRLGKALSFYSSGKYMAAILDFKERYCALPDVTNHVQNLLKQKILSH